MANSKTKLQLIRAKLALHFLEIVLKLCCSLDSSTGLFGSAGFCTSLIAFFRLGKPGTEFALYLDELCFCSLSLNGLVLDR